MKTNGADRLQKSPIHLLHRAGQCADELFQAAMKSDGLTPRQLAVLVVVEENEGLSQTGIVERTGIDRSTLADVVRRLQKRGLLQRRRTREDARAYAVKLTDKGRSVLSTARPTARTVDERVLGALPIKHREQFIGALQTIVTILQSTSPGDGSSIAR